MKTKTKYKGDKVEVLNKIEGTNLIRIDIKGKGIMIIEEEDLE